MAELDLIIGRILTVALVIAPVTAALVTLVIVAARAFGDAIPAISGRAGRRNVPEEDPAPRWRPELAGSPSDGRGGGQGR